MRRPPTGYRELRVFTAGGRHGPETRLNLVALFGRLETLFPSLRSHEWTLLYGADGYGEDVVDASARLGRGETVAAAGAKIMGWLTDGEQYFEDVHLRVAELGLEFGICDSTFLFFRGPDDAMQAIAGAYSNAQVVDR